MIDIFLREFVLDFSFDSVEVEVVVIASNEYIYMMISVRYI